MVSLVVFLLVVLFAFLGAAVLEVRLRPIPGRRVAAAERGHPFGTDRLGHDMLAQVMRGTQQSLKIALLVAILATGSARCGARSPASTAAGSTRS